MVWGMEFRERVWAAQMMKIGAIVIESEAVKPAGAHLIAVNHRSSIDPLINLADILCYPIAKIEFSKWPIIGFGAAQTGIVFVDRSSKESKLATRQAIADTIKAGMNVLIYPEGMTGDGDLTRTFKKGSFEVAAQYGLPVLPVAMEYKEREDNWDHSENFVQHFFKRFGKRKTVIKLRYGTPIVSDNSWTLLRQSQKWINHQIEDMRSDWDGPNWKREVVQDKVNSSAS